MTHPRAGRRRRPGISPGTILALAALPAVSGCHRSPQLPSTFEEIAKSTVEGHRIMVVRDTGTGCEMIMTGEGQIMPRSERSADGASVKQRCVITGDETPAPITMTTLPASGTGFGQPSLTPPRPVGTDAQEQAVRDAVREATQSASAIPPAGPAIPPPSGKRSSAARTADSDDDLQSQLKP